ncbi:CYP3A4.2 family protein [Megaselia abdita]
MFVQLLIAAVSVLAYYLWRTFKHWEHEGIPFEEPSIPFGILKPLIKGESSFGMTIFDIYNKSKEPFLGLYLMLRPAILVRDATLCKDILTKDFGSFHDRGVYVDEKNDPFSGNLFSAEGQSWKSLRTKLTPSFTSGKLKAMYPTMIETADKLKKSLLERLPKGETKVIEIKDLMNSYAIDIIASVIFGVETDSFKDPDNEFRLAARDANTPDFLNKLRGAALFLYPQLGKVFRICGYKDKAEQYMKRLIKETVEHREKNNVVRKDLMQMLIQLRNSGQVNTDDDNWKFQTVAENLKSMSMEKLSGQGFLFFVAGFETTASTASYCLYELTQNPELKELVVKEIDEVLSRYNGEITYEGLQEMKLLDRCVMETNRKYPGLPILNRISTEDFKVPGSDYVIKQGTPIIISLMGLHRDPANFPNPMKFDPDRFETNNYNPSAYMPFGEGPRNCIAFRLGRVSAKNAIVTVLSNFNIECSEKKELEIDNYSVVIVPKGGVNIKFSRK